MNQWQTTSALGHLPWQINWHKKCDFIMVYMCFMLLYMGIHKCTVRQVDTVKFSRILRPSKNTANLGKVTSCLNFSLNFHLKYDSIILSQVALERTLELNLWGGSSHANWWWAFGQIEQHVYNRARYYGWSSVKRLTLFLIWQIAVDLYLSTLRGTIFRFNISFLLPQIWFLSVKDRNLSLRLLSLCAHII